MSNRGHGEGTIYHRKDGRWEARITVGVKPDGKPKRVALYGKTRAEVKDKLTKALGQLQQGSFIVPDKTTFGQWLDYWLNNCIRPPIRSESTWALAEGNVRNHIKPTLGQILLAKLQASHLQVLYNTLAKSDRSIRTVYLVRQTVNSALKRAVKEGKIHRNVNEGTELEPLYYKEITPLTYEQAMAFLEAAKKSPYYVAFLLELATALRRGEILALVWVNIDFNDCTIFIERTLKRVKMPDGPKKTTLKFRRPKTKKSKSKVAFPEWIKDELIRHQWEQEDHKKNAKGEYKDNGLVFATSLGGPIEPGNLLRACKTILKNAKLPQVSFQALRHTVATLLLENGEEMKAIQELLRHSRLSTASDIYTTWTDKLQKRTATRIGEILRPPDTAKSPVEPPAQPTPHSGPSHDDNAPS